MIRVLIVDDHELVRTGFRLILAAQADIEIVADTGTAEDAYQLLRKHNPDVVLMDVNLPGVSGIEATERIVSQYPNTYVLAVSMQEQEPVPRKLLAAGASGFVGKACPANELVEAVRKVARGEKYLSSTVAQNMALAKLSPTRGESPFEELSPKELEVAMMVARGESAPQIAARMHISPKTVGTHKYRAYEKLGVDSDVAISQLAAKWGLIQN